MVVVVVVVVATVMSSLASELSRSPKDCESFGAMYANTLYVAVVSSVLPPNPSSTVIVWSATPVTRSAVA